MSVDPRRLKELFLGANQIPDRAQREAWLAQQCGQELDLLAKVQALLKARDNPESFLDLLAPPAAVPQEEVAQKPCPAPAALLGTIDEPITERLGSRIGPYKLLQQIGEGGMGIVFMAEQEKPVHRKVALKIIKPGMDSAQVIARFDAERQALALMDHQNIARVLDAGATASGRPYFVMELVKGVPITKFCDDNHLTPRERLELFVPVCQAIQHAHQKGIIHRDIKPSNVLVTLYDGKPVPKVIDFGVAKAIEQRLTERTLFTQIGQVVGTLEYMSPEQAEINALDIDTRSDIYSLGVLLYELLTGSTPLEKQRLRSAAFTEMLRMIREEEPPKPSTRLSGSKDQLASISAHRKTEPAKLTKLVRGELDWIVMKALEKDRGRRYETANGFARDIQRYLTDEPVEACPPSAGYKLRKFARKNRKALATACAFVLLLAAATVISTWQAIRATQAETKARQAQTLAEERFNLAKEAVDKYLNEVTETPELKIANFHALRRKLLDAALPFYRKLAEQAPGDPEREAARGLAYGRLGQIHLDLEEDAAALADYRAMHALFARLSEAFPSEPAYRRDLSRSLRGQGEALLSRTGVPRDRESNLGQVEAEPVFRSALAIIQQLANDVPSNPEYRSDLALLLEKLGKQAEAEAQFRAALAEQQRSVDEEPRAPGPRWQLVITRNKLGNALRSQGKLAEAESQFRAALAEQQRVADENPDVPSYRLELASSHDNLANVLEDQGKPADAKAEFRALSTELQRLVTEYPNVPDYRRYLGIVYRTLGKPAEAEAEFRAALKDYQRFADEHPELPVYWRELAKTYYSLWTVHAGLGKWAEDEADNRAILKAYKRLADEHPDAPDYRFQIAIARNNLASALSRQGKHAEAVAESRAALQETQRLTDEHPNFPKYRSLLANHHANLAVLLDFLGEPAQVEAELRAAFKESQYLVDQHPNIASMRTDLARHHMRFGIALMRKGDMDGAIREHQTALRIDPAFAIAHCSLGDVLLKQGRFAEALAAHKRGHELGSKDPRWPYPSAQWVRNTEKLVALEAKLPKLLKGEAQSADAAEQLALARLCQLHKRLYAAATGFYNQAFAVQPEMADNPNTQDRYNAACAAALAGCGQGKDADKLDAKERARLRQQAFDWLRADLKAYEQAMDKPADKAEAAIAQRMQHWLKDDDFAGVRGVESLAHLPEAERKEWQKLWEEVESLRQRALQTPKTTGSAGH